MFHRRTPSPALSRTARPTRAPRLKFGGRTPSRISSSITDNGPWPLRKAALSGLIIGAFLWVAAEIWRWMAGAHQSTPTAIFAILSRTIRPFTFQQGVLWTLVLTAIVFAWWGLAKIRNWRRPSVPLAALLSLQFLAVIHLWIPSHPGPPPKPALWLAAAGIALLLLSLLTGWGAAPGQKLISAEGAPRSAVGFLRRSRIPIRALGVLLILVSFGLTLSVFLPMYKAPIGNFRQPGLSEAILLLAAADAAFLFGRNWARRTWRAG